MTVIRYPNGIVTCLAADTKPAIQNAFGFAIETDTGKVFITTNSGGTWTQISLSVAQLIGTLSLTTQVTGTLPVANGGTGAATLTGILKGNGTSAVTAAAQLAVADGGTGAATLTGILKGNGTSAFTAVTAPSGAILGDTDTQTETNKTMDALLNTFRNLVQSALVRPSGDWHGRAITGSNNIATSGLLNGTHTIITGTGATHTATFDATGLHDRMSTGTTVNTLVGHRFSSMTCRGFNPNLSIKFALNQVTNTRMILGLHENAGSAPSSSADPMNTFSGVALWFDSAVSANWKVYYNSAGGTNLTDTTIGAGTGVHTLKIIGDDANTKFTFELTDGADAISVRDVTGDIPAQFKALGIYCYIENTLAATASTFDLYPIHIEQDK